jgi:formylglycine-generating enzyme required for sulfatase activity
MQASNHPLVNLLFVSIFNLVLSSCYSGTEKQFATFTEKYGNIVFVKVPKGSFTMGNTGQAYERYDDDEYPTHTVTFANDLFVGKYEVTQAQWSTVMAGQSGLN